MYAEIITAIAIVMLLFIVWLMLHQRKLKLRAHLMKEAVRNKDFTFRLPSKGLLPGEKAMQQALNELGGAIQTEMNKNEVRSWERLMRVLTHEIMNATAPISSISQSMLTRKDVKDTALEEGVRAINATANHLNSFVESYRKLLQLQAPTPETIVLADFIEQQTALYPDIEWHVAADTQLKAYTDPSMLRQVFVNIIKNAQEANAKKMAIHAESVADNAGERQVYIYISNDGAPITPESISAIFIPFFTTKRTGTGIGLSLCRQIMTRLGGEIILAENPKNSYITTFVLQLPHISK